MKLDDSKKRPSADELIELLGLEPHPCEGGYFKETYRSAECIHADCLPVRYKPLGEEKSYSTCIYYLLTPDTCSRMHRLRSDEIFHFYLGDPVEMLWLYPKGEGEIHELGSDVISGQRLQLTVPMGIWQGAALKPGGEYALLGTTVAPGFDYEDYETGERSKLLELYPAYKDRIIALTPR